ncbi:MAG: DUF2970 domain-containing protein [Gammaproteobacteria bacterium]|nr:DUF2970 domain-containing protein [Gammaproteobacteria bacterium]
MRARDRDQEGLTLWQTIVSTAAAMFGVQKNENRIRDFSKGKPHQFIIAGLIGTALFVLVVVLVVQVVMRVAGQ